ncbi:MAG: hypothetical protein AAGF74_15000 [Pseudomonadota bacterium]
MPQLVRFYIRHTMFGFIAAAVFVTLLFAFNVANLWHLVTHTSEGWLAALLLFVFNGIVFSGVQFGIAVMALGNEQAPPRGPRGRALLVPAPVRRDEPPHR